MWPDISVCQSYASLICGIDPESGMSTEQACERSAVYPQARTCQSSWVKERLICNAEPGSSQCAMLLTPRAEWRWEMRVVNCPVSAFVSTRAHAAQACASEGGGSNVYPKLARSADMYSSTMRRVSAS